MSDPREHDQPRPSGDDTLPARVPPVSPVRRSADASRAPVPRKSVHLAQTATGTIPLGASHAPPRIDALPERGAALYLVLGLSAAAVAGSFLVLIISKL
ncbi:hypothetical protein ASA1KI_28620 [Opitutales bacterium ASA1]|uniref:hypothetical protein n=1 Tax=Congregicoccus parvus TaxID=3081749 RepID=UPI002B27CCE2|nr:hypothetical protein ASA1KI_28620 [Opitutales bacterium ASA1]